MGVRKHDLKMKTHTMKQNHRFHCHLSCRQTNISVALHDERNAYTLQHQFQQPMMEIESKSKGERQRKKNGEGRVLTYPEPDEPPLLPPPEVPPPPPRPPLLPPLLPPPELPPPPPRPPPPPPPLRFQSSCETASTSRSTIWMGSAGSRRARSDVGATRASAGLAQRAETRMARSIFMI